MEGEIQQGRRTLDVGNGDRRHVQLSIDSVGQVVVQDQQGIRAVGETEPEALDAARVAIREGIFSDSAVFEGDDA